MLEPEFQGPPPPGGRDTREAHVGRDRTGLSDDEVAFYEALEVNDAPELVEAVWQTMRGMGNAACRSRGRCLLV